MSIKNSLEQLSRFADQATPLLDRTTEQVSALAHRSLDGVRDTSLQLRQQALRASDSTVDYIKREPTKSLLIGAAIGVTLLALAGLFSRSRDRR